MVKKWCYPCANCLIPFACFRLVSSDKLRLRPLCHPSTVTGFLHGEISRNWTEISSIHWFIIRMGILTRFTVGLLDGLLGVAGMMTLLVVRMWWNGSWPRKFPPKETSTSARIYGKFPFLDHRIYHLPHQFMVTPSRPEWWHNHPWNEKKYTETMAPFSSMS